MTWTLVAHNAVGFADGNAGHVYTLPAGAPAAGDLDVLCINSDTVVSMPAGFSGATNFVNSQGSYLFYRFAVGGESGTVTISTSGNFDTQLSWQRWQGGSTFDSAANAHADGSAGTTTPALTTATLGTSNDLVVAFAALHSPTGGTLANPVWSSGYTATDQTTQGGVAGLISYKTGAGTAAESPSVSWTNTYNDRYILVAAFTPSAGPAPDVKATSTATVTGRTSDAGVTASSTSASSTTAKTTSTSTVGG